MSPEIWLLFVATETALCLTPGLAVLTVVSHGINRGTSAGLCAATGVLLANGLCFAISATGLFALLIAWHEVFLLVKWLGAAYLIWTGIQSWRGHSTQSTESPPTPVPADRAELRHASRPASQEGWRAGRRGFAVQATNPKTLLFFGALLPQFIDPSGAVGLQFAILGATSIAIEFCVLAMYSALANRASGFARQPNVATWLDRVSGTLLIAAGAGLATIRR